ncbi:hypothetical protein QZH41_020634, partial [Actinostola sp. cb2023]
MTSSSSEQLQETTRIVQLEHAEPCDKPSASGVNESEAKRQKTQDINTGEPSIAKPPDKPQFQSACRVGRNWYFTRRNGSRHRQRSIAFKIISYNVLADSLLRCHPMLYEDCEKWLLEWEYRKKNLLKEILHYDADILCLQEVEEQHYKDWFQPELFKA